MSDQHKKSISIILILDGDFYDVPVEFLDIKDEFGRPITYSDLLLYGEESEDDGDLSKFDIDVSLTKEELERYKIEGNGNRILN